MSAKPQEWQNVDSGDIYVMILKDDWDQGREAVLKEFEAIAFHWEQERKGGAARYREAAIWLRNAIRRVRENRPYTVDD